MKNSKKSTSKKASTKAKKGTVKKVKAKKITGEVQPEQSEEELHVLASNDSSITTTDQDQLKNLKTFEELDFFLDTLKNSGKKLVSKTGVEVQHGYDRLPDTLTYNNGKQIVRVQALSKYFTIE